MAYIDIRMPPGIDGMETIRRIRKIDRTIEIVIMTAELLDKLLYIRKPFAREEVQQITRALAEKWHVERKLEAQRQELAASYQRLVTILNSTDEAMALFDSSSRLMFANRNYEKLMGSTTAQLQELSPKALMEQVRARFNWPLPEESHAGVTVEGRGHIVEHVANGKRLLFHRSRRPVHDPHGEILGELYVYRDVSRDFEISRMHSEVLRLRTELS
ncbi:MAG: PAS domain S-box protein, partial [Rhodospirillaceae bacterium]|nr:PAS domain S-box protein [Rhodospirillaceae bacterium]